MKLKTISITSITSLIILLLLFVVYKFYQPSKITYRIASFNQLHGWDKADFQKSLQTFQTSCKVFLNMKPAEMVGSQKISMQAKDWQPACLAAAKIQSKSQQEARNFFEKWFIPIEWHEKQTAVQGLFTGYYVPYFAGSLQKTEEYQVPIYGLPSDLVTIALADFSTRFPPEHLVGQVTNHKLRPYFTRAQINNGILQDKAPVLVWAKSHIDRLFLEIEGSGIVELTDGRKLNLGYAGENGATYTSIARIFIEKGLMNKDNASMQRIRAYLEAHPSEIVPIINQNKSFVFFQIKDDSAALGAQGVNLTPGYSLAVDRKWIPLGAPLWLDTTRPKLNANTSIKLQRLMVAQDTGGAIRGAVRGDVFWGGGEKATNIAGRMKNPGHYWVLLPQHMLPQLSK